MTKPQEGLSLFCLYSVAGPLGLPSAHAMHGLLTGNFHPPPTHWLPRDSRPSRPQYPPCSGPPHLGVALKDRASSRKLVINFVWQEKRQKISVYHASGAGASGLKGAGLEVLGRGGWAPLQVMVSGGHWREHSQEGRMLAWRGSASLSPHHPAFEQRVREQSCVPVRLGTLHRPTDLRPLSPGLL